MFLEINTNSRDKAYEIKDNLDVFLKENVFPKLESHFEALEKEYHFDIVRIEKLDLDLKFDRQFSNAELQDEIIKNIDREIRKKIEQETFEDATSEVFVNTEKSKLKSFFYFLKKGTTPWWDTQTTNFLLETDQIEEIINTTGFENAIVESLKNPVSKKRLIKQFKDEVVRSILIPMYESNIHSIEFDMLFGDDLITFLKHVSDQDRVIIWDAIIQFLYTNNSLAFYQILKEIASTKEKELINKDSSWLSTIINSVAQELADTETSESDKKISDVDIVQKEPSEDSIIRMADEETISDEQIQEKEHESNTISINEDQVVDKDSIEKRNSLAKSDDHNEVNEETAESYFISNAGLILLHPYLKYFLEHCNLLDADSKHIRDQELAAHLLHFVATQKQEQPEHLMIFEKFLCNIPIHQPIVRDITLFKEHKDHAEELLEATLKNWGALKNASPDLLRNEFIQRPGKLILKGDNPKIIIERKTQDILLDRLPWNISVIKLPWKDKLIFVDW